MKKLFLATVLMAGVGVAAAANYKIDPYHANARFAIDHFGTSTNVGGFYGLEGTVQFDRAKHTGSVDVRIPMASLQSGSEKFTQHLKSSDLFNAAQYPEIRFVSEKFVFQGDKVSEVVGRLTLLGKTQMVTLKANKFNCYQHPMLKAEVCGGDFETTIDRSKWGMDYLISAGMTKNVKLDIQIEAVKQ